MIKLAGVLDQLKTMRDKPQRMNLISIDSRSTIRRLFNQQGLDPDRVVHLLQKGNLRLVLLMSLIKC